MLDLQAWGPPLTFDFKKADRSSLMKEYKRIAKATGDDQFFTKRELRHIPEILADGEQVKAFASGMMDGNTWLIALTDRRIIFLDKGMFWGLKQASINIDKINAVSGSTGVLFGNISIEDGASERAITMVPKKTVVSFTNLVRDAIELRRRPITISAPQTDDIVSQLERLASLLEKGILTQAEFETQKQRLLSR